MGREKQVLRFAQDDIRFQHQDKGRKPRGRRPFLLPVCYYSKIKMAAAIVVVHRPRLSPMADCVTFAVRTILFEMR